MSINAGIERIVCREDYPDDLGKSLLATSRVRLEILAPGAK